jgi:transcriptional regulator with XRE-family HTH domain
MARRPIRPQSCPARLRFGRRLRHWRTTAALTQAELGRALTYDHSYISKVESGVRWPPKELAERCDRLLGARRELIELWSVAEEERRREVAWAADTFADLLARAAGDAPDRVPAPADRAHL